MNDKLKIIEAQQQNIYNAGQESIYIHNKVLQANQKNSMIYIDDFAIINNDNITNILLTEPTIPTTDFSSFIVEKYGKNLFNLNKINSGFVSGTSGSSYPSINNSYPNNSYFEIKVYAGQILYFSGINFNDHLGRVRYADPNGIIKGTIQSENEYLASTAAQSSQFQNSCFTIKKDCILIFLFLSKNGYTNKNFQLEFKNWSSYTPCTCEQLKVQKTGKIELNRIIQDTTLISNDAKIDIKYYKDIDKVFNNLASNIALSGGE